MERLHRFLVSVDVAMRTPDRAEARRRFDVLLGDLGLEAGKTRQTSGYVKDEVRSRVFGTAAITASSFSQLATRMRRLDAALFNRPPNSPSRYFRLLSGEPQGVEIVGPSPDDLIDDEQVVWVNIEFEDSEEWNARLAVLHDEDRSTDRDDHFRVE